MSLSETTLEMINDLAGDEGFWDDDNRDAIISIAEYLKTSCGMAEEDIMTMLSDLWDAIEDEVSC